MNTLARLKGFWAKMDAALGSLTDAINLRTPRQGDGISINETPNGFLISLRSVPPVAQAVTDSGSGLTDDQKALLKALASDPGIGGTFPKTVPPTDHSGATTPGAVEWLPWKRGATSGWRRITFLAPFTADDGTITNSLYEDWVWSGSPFNPRPCDANTFGGG